MFGAPLRTDTMNATAAAVRFYDGARVEHSERSARVMAELYLRRKCPEVDGNTAAVAIADALAVRASERIAAKALAVAQGLGIPEPI